jgi:hypothetical protein
MLHRTRIAICALTMLLAIGAVATSTASAKGLVLSEEGIALAPGAGFDLYGEENFEVGTSAGYVSCEEGGHRNDLDVGVLTNSKAKDELQIDDSDLYAERCESFTGNAGVSGSIEGPLELRRNGTTSTGPVGLRIDFERLVYNGGTREAECGYTRKSLKGTNTATSTSQALEVELRGTLKFDASLSGFEAKRYCPKQASLVLYLESSEATQPPSNRSKSTPDPLTLYGRAPRRSSRL